MSSHGSTFTETFVLFDHRFLDKTKNEWECRAGFEKVAGKYDMVHMDYSTNVEVEFRVVLLMHPDVPEPDQSLQHWTKLTARDREAFHNKRGF